MQSVVVDRVAVFVDQLTDANGLQSCLLQIIENLRQRFGSVLRSGVELNDRAAFYLRRHPANDLLRLNILPVQRIPTGSGWMGAGVFLV